MADPGAIGTTKIRLGKTDELLLVHDFVGRDELFCE